MTIPTTIKQKVVTLDLEDQKVNVRRMPWKAAKSFLKLLAKHLGGIGTNLTDIVAKLPDLITNVDELATFLVTNSSDLSAEDFDKLDLVQAAIVLQTALELNCGEELKNSLAGIAAVLGGLVPAGLNLPKMKAGEGSTSDSSTEGTQPST